MCSTKRGSDIVDLNEVQVRAIEDACHGGKAGADGDACDRPMPKQSTWWSSEKSKVALVDINLKGL
jgi:hypothetical protein